MSAPVHGTHSAYVHLRCRCDACRDGEAAYQRAYRERNREQLLAYDRRPERDTRLRDDPAKRQARQRAKDHVAQKQGRHPCSVCGAEYAQMHHADYARPLDVEWLCSACHGRAHRKPNTARACGLLP